VNVTAKQAEALRVILLKDRTGLIWPGSIRSGKTWGMSMAMVCHAARFDGQQFIVAGKTLGAIERNILPYLHTHCRDLGIPLRNVRSRNVLQVGRNEFFLFGAGDESAQDVIQGMTAAGALIDEVPLLPRSAVMQIFARCSVPGAKLLMTLNKVSPFHWVKRELYDRHEEMDLDVIESTLDDNPHITERTVGFYNSVFQGHWRKRFIDNEWAAPNGLVYPQPNIIAELPDGLPDLIDLCADFGAATVTTGLKVGKWGNRWVVFGEYYWDTTMQEPRTTDEHAAAIVALTPRIDRCIIDPSAATLKVSLQRAGVIAIGGNNDIEAGVQNLDLVLSTDKLAIHGPSCPNLVGEITALAWDEDKQEEGEDKPKKGHDHACDALRYWAMFRIPPQLSLMPRRKPRGL